MTRSQYASLGFTLPDCKVRHWPIPGAGWVVEIRTPHGRGRFVVELGDSAPSKEDFLHRLLHVEAPASTEFLADFVAEWGDQSPRGRQAAVREWIRLRRQRRTLKRLFPEECP